MLFTCFLFILTNEALPHRGCSAPSFILHIWEFTVGIYRENLPQEFAVGICRSYLPWVFCIRRRILFCIYEQILFIWQQTFFICEQNFLICEIFFINSVSFSYSRGTYGPPYVTDQFVIFNPWKTPWNWIAFYQNCFVISPGPLYHLIRRDSGRLSNEAFTSNPIISSKQ